MGLVILMLGMLLLAACAAGDKPTSAPTVGPPEILPTLMPTPTGALPPTAIAPTATLPPADTGWIAAGPGAELRRLRIELAGTPIQVSVVRLDPTQVRFEVGYAPDEPPMLSAWAARSGALALINGGFFDEQNRTTALLIHAGQAEGESYSGRGGMFMVYPDGSVGIRALADAPYDPDEPLAEALQGWPLLVRPGGEAAYSFEDGERARRSVIAIDRVGRVLLIASSSTGFTLRELSEWLAGADLEIDTAVNLDGGASTGLLLLNEQTSEHVDAYTPLPIVLLAYRKS